MLMDTYFQKTDELFARIRETQSPAIQAAARLIADSVQAGGCVHVFDTGHLLSAELIYRAGGPALIKAFKYNLTVEDAVRARPDEGKSRSLEGLAALALKVSNVKNGDVMIIGSVSGKTVNVIDLALEAKAMGVKVIAMTSVEYSSRLKSDHASGKRLMELGDVLLDNCAPFGDAMMEVEGLEAPMCPASGMAAAYIMWAVVAQLADELLKDGKWLSVYKSVNYPGNAEYNVQLNERYAKTGL
jgi:uncharacterized phosphosugar-binding protein